MIFKSKLKRVEPGRNNLVRDRLGKTIFGEGLDLGPWHMPFPLPYADAKLVDRYSAQEMKTIFAEFNLVEDGFLPNSDFIINFDLDGLKVLESERYDFVIASHLLEHLSQPFLFLQEMVRVTKEGGVIFIALPDRRFTFDLTRPLLPFSHFENEMNLGFVYADDNHVEEYLSHVVKNNSPTTKDKELERARSYHVHVFEDEYFVQLLVSLCDKLNMGLKLIDGAPSIVNKEPFEEFILVFEKTPAFNVSQVLDKWKEIKNRKN
jgi:SAM-dependent methyltransferase